jgi:hypothetical protein
MAAGLGGEGGVSVAQTRRAVLRALGAAALLPAFAGGALAQAGGRPIAPPPQPMIFRRNLRREMAGGLAVVAQRDFEIRFERLAAGHRIEGRQIASTVEAPPSLEAFARLERERVEDGMFPLLLDEQGLIMSGPEGRPSASVEHALDLALAQVSAELKAAGDVAEARGFILGLQQAAGTIASVMPVDLFVPPEILQRASRRMSLPDGTSGDLSTEYSGTLTPETGLLRDAKRVIVTDTGGSRRETVETWTLRIA